ncbi:hypothetical protein ACU8KO_002666 [Vibrio alginolyticus]
MTKQTRIFVDATSKTVIHAIEEEHNTFQRTVEELPPLKRISNISRSQLKQGSRQQGTGDDVFNALMAEGNYVEVDEDSLLVRKKWSDAELDKQTQHLAFVLGLKSTKDVDYLRKALALMEDGKLAHENVEACEAKPEPKPAPVVDESHKAIIIDVARTAIQEFDEKGYVDWRTRDSMLAKLRNIIRRRLLSKPGVFLQPVVNRHVDELLSSQHPA